MNQTPSNAAREGLERHAVDGQALHAGRAQVYAWFSVVFAGELSEAMITAYQQGAARALLQGLAACGLAQEVARLEAAIDGWGAIPLLKEELAADFALLFLVDGKQAAMPYASAYLDPEGQLYGQPHQKMQAFLRASGLQVHAAFREPSDHLAVLLAAMEVLIRKAVPEAVDRPPGDFAAAQAAFLRDSLQAWLPRFVQRCEQLRQHTVSDFHTAAAALLAAFVAEDIAFLETASEPV